MFARRVFDPDIRRRVLVQRLEADQTRWPGERQPQTVPLMAGLCPSHPVRGRRNNPATTPANVIQDDPNPIWSGTLERIPVMLNHFSRVMAGLVPAIYVLLAEAPQERRGCPRQARA